MAEVRDVQSSFIVDQPGVSLYLERVFNTPVSAWGKVLDQTAPTNYSVMDAMLFLGRTFPLEETNLFFDPGYEPGMRDCTYKIVLFSFSDAVVRLVNEVRSGDVVAQASNSLVYAYTGLLRSTGSNWTQQDYPRRYRYCYKSGDAGQV